MGNVAIHYPHEIEIGLVYTACMISMLRLAEHVKMSAIEEAAFTYAHTVLSEFMGRMDQKAIDQWRRGIIVALEEIRKEEHEHGRDRQSNPTDTGGNRQHHT